MRASAAEAALREAIASVEAAGVALRSRERASLVDALAETWERIADPERAAGRAAREEIPKSSGLSLPMVAWALSTTLGDVRGELRRLAARMRPPEGTLESPPRLGAVILAGNVFTACVQPLSAALLAKVPIVVKASSEDDALPRLFGEVLREIDPDLAAAYLVVTIPGGTPRLEATLLARAGVVSAYGSDETLASIRGRLDASTALVMHGHGLGLGCVAPGAPLEAAAEAFALDVAAYDQRGCMSPHAIGVETGTDAHRFARLLADALSALEPEMPRGVLPAEIGAAQVQWRGVAAARGALYEGDHSAVSYEGEVAPRLSPGWRNVMVYRTDDFAGHASALGLHLKAVGVAGDVMELARTLPAPLAPRVCPAGRMQMPPLSAPADGLPPWHGFVRLISVEPSTPRRR